jgi:hypothetical protein
MPTVAYADDKSLFRGLDNLRRCSKHQCGRCKLGRPCLRHPDTEGAPSMQSKPTTRIPQAGVFCCPVCETTWTAGLPTVAASSRQQARRGDRRASKDERDRALSLTPAENSIGRKSHQALLVVATPTSRTVGELFGVSSSADRSTTFLGLQLASGPARESCRTEIHARADRVGSPTEGLRRLCGAQGYRQGGRLRCAA